VGGLPRSPVPNGEGPGAPERLWGIEQPETGATRQWNEAQSWDDATFS